MNTIGCAQAGRAVCRSENHCVARRPDRVLQGTRFNAGVVVAPLLNMDEIVCVDPLEKTLVIEKVVLETLLFALADRAYRCTLARALWAHRQQET